MADELPIPEVMTPERIDAWRAFLEAHSVLVTELDGALRKAGCDFVTYSALLELERAGGKLSMGDLAGRLVITPSRLTRLTDRLASEGLVERSVSLTDRRSVIVELTDEGDRVFTELVQLHLDDVARLFARHLTQKEATAMARGLGKVLSAFGR